MRPQVWWPSTPMGGTVTCQHRFAKLTHSCSHGHREGWIQWGGIYVFIERISSNSGMIVSWLANIDFRPATQKHCIFNLPNSHLKNSKLKKKRHKISLNTTARMTTQHRDNAETIQTSGFRDRTSILITMGTIENFALTHILNIIYIQSQEIHIYCQKCFSKLILLLNFLQCCIFHWDFKPISGLARQNLDILDCCCMIVSLNSPLGALR